MKSLKGFLSFSYLVILFSSSCVPVGEFKEEKSDLEFKDFKKEAEEERLRRIANRTLTPFQRAQNVLNSRCLNCHGEGRNRSWGINSDSTEDDWLTRTPRGLVVIGNIKESGLTRRSIHYPGGGGNMPIGANASTFTRSEYLAIQDWITSLGSPADCQDVGLNHNESQERIRFQSENVPFGSTCVSERQQRSCEFGLATDFGGNFQFSNCNVEVPVQCNPGEQETRTRYLTNTVAFGSSCISEVQNRSCQNGTFTAFSGSYTFSSCQVLAPASCDGVAHGQIQSRTRYLQSVTQLPQTCTGELQVRTCDNGVWSDFSGSYGFAACEERQVVNARERGFDIIENNCLSCHSHNLDFGRDESRFTSSRFFDRNNPDNSLILRRTRGHGGVLSNMPPTNASSYATWSDSLYEELRAWVNLIRPSSSGNTTTYGRFNCNENSDLKVTPLKRLSRLEMVETYYTMIREVENRDNAWTGWINGALNVLPKDDSEGFKEEDNTLSSTHIIGIFNAANEMAHWLTESGNRCRRGVKEWLGDSDHILCDSRRAFNSITQSSFRVSFQRMALRIFRRPATMVEADEYFVFAQEDIDAGLSPAHTWRNILSQMLQSPYFINHAQLNGIAVPNKAETYYLTPYELANKLSYAFWKRQPDSTLFNYAASGNLNHDASAADYQEVINYIFNKSATESHNSGSVRNSFKSFLKENYQLSKTHSYGWMPNDKVQEYITSRGIVRPSNGNHFIAAQNQEVFDLFNYYTFDTQGTFSNVLTSNLYFTQDATIASIYGVSPLNPGDAPGTLDGSRYSGLTTRVFMNFKGKGDTNPIHRGARLRESILCDELTAPEDVLSVEEQLIALRPPPFDHTISTLERFDDKVSDPVCMGCHGLINPLGNIHESYDTSGKFRDVERMVHRGNIEVVSIPNNDLIPRVAKDDFSTVITGPVRLAQEFDNSGKAHACFAEKIFQYTNYRPLEDNIDQCVVGRVYDRLENGNILDAIKEVVLHPSFKMKKVN